MSTGADNKTMPVTKEYADGYERTFGDRKPTRGKWVVHPKTGEIIPAEEYVRPESDDALHAPVMAGRFYENQKMLDGTDIGSRRKHHDYMKVRGLVDVSDCKGLWAEKAKEREKVFKGEHDIRERRDQVGRAMYELQRKRR